MDKKRTLKERNYYWNLEKGDLLPLLLLLPATCIVVFVLIIPIGYGLFISLFEYDMGGSFNLKESFVGLANYIRMGTDKALTTAVTNTLVFTVGAIAGDLVFATIVALVLHHISVRMSKIMRPLVTMSLLVSPIVVGLVWRYMYDPQYGLVYYFLKFFGIGIAEFPGTSGKSTALFSCMVAYWWQAVPFVVIVLSAGLLAIPSDLYEAAHIDGAGPIRTFFSITLPHLSNMYMVVLLISGVDAIKIFDIIYSLTQGGPNNATISISMLAFKYAFNQYEIGYSMSISILTMAITFLLFGYVFMKFNNRTES